MSPIKHRRLWRETITGLSMALFAGVATADIATPNPGCPPIGGTIEGGIVTDILDVDFREQNPWASADSNKSYRPEGSNLTLAAGPKLGWSMANGIGANNDALDGPSEDLAITPYWTPETISGFCVSNLSPSELPVGTATVTYVYLDNDGGIFFPTADVPCPAETTPAGNYCTEQAIISIDASTLLPPVTEVLFEFSDPLLATQLEFTTAGSKVQYSIAGLKLSKENTINCEDQCTNEVYTDIRQLILTGEFNTRAVGLEAGSKFIATAKLEEVFTAPETREECYDPTYPTGCAEPRGLVIDFDEKTSQPVCGDPVNLPDRRVLIPGDFCGIEVNKQTRSDGLFDRVVRVGDSNSSVRNITRELFEGEIDYLVPKPDLTLPACKVLPTDPVVLWGPKNYTINPDDQTVEGSLEVPVLQETGGRERHLIDLTNGCGSTRFSALRSWTAWQLEASANVDFPGIFRNNVSLVRAGLRETLACTNNGEQVSAISAYVDKILRYFERGEWPRTVMEIESFLDQINAPDVVDEFSKLYWDFETDQTVCLDQPPDPMDERYAPAAYNSLFNGLGSALRYQVCSRFAVSRDDDGDGYPDNWGDTGLTATCGDLLPAE